MLNRVAVLSDIHGALPALEAVLAEPDVAAADLIVLTGDIAAGPQPVEVLDLLADLGDRACWVRGNADRELVEARAGHLSPVDVSNWAAELLRDDQLARLAALPLTVTLEIAGLGPVLFCHATPATTRRSCSSTPGWNAGRRCSPTSPPRWERWSAGTPTCRSPGWPTAG